MSSTRLLVLGVVRIFQPVHGYDVRRELLTWRAEEWANVNPGSIYHALKALTRDGMVRVVETDATGARPERTAYELTADGDAEFFGLLRDSLWQLSRSALPLRAGLAFITALSREELLALVRNRIAQLEATRESMRFVSRDGLHPGHLEHLHLGAALIEGELVWARGFHDRLQAGDYDLTSSAD